MESYEVRELKAVEEFTDAIRVDLAYRTLTNVQARDLQLAELDLERFREFEDEIGQCMSPASCDDLRYAWLRFYYSLLSSRIPARDELIFWLEDLANPNGDLAVLTSSERSLTTDAGVTPKEIAFRFYSMLVGSDPSVSERAIGACLDMIEALRDRPTIYWLRRNPTLRYLFRAIHLAGEREALPSVLPSNGDKMGASRTTPLYVFGRTFYRRSIGWADERLSSATVTPETTLVLDSAKSLLNEYRHKDYGPVLDMMRAAATDNLLIMGRLRVDAHMK